jgi:hypothetical protein
MAAFPLQPGMADVLDGGGAAQMTAAPPQNPQEVEGRKAAWQQVLDDPNVKSAILRMGLNLMQGREQGESTMGAIGRTGIDAMDFYGFKTELDRKRALDERGMKLDERRADASIARDESLTTATNQQTSQEQAKFAEWTSQADLRKQKAQQEVQTLIAQGKSAEAQALKAKFEADEMAQFQAFKEANPALANASYTATLEAPVAQVRADKARANASNASAAASMEQVDASKESRAATPAWIAALPDEEARTYAMVHKGTKTQPQIEQEIAAGMHHGTSRKFDTSTATTSGFEGMADSLILLYSQLDPIEKSRYKSFDDWVLETQQATVGKSTGEVLRIAKAKLAQGGGAPAAQPAPASQAPAPGQRVEGQTYQTPRGPMKWTKEGWISP